MQNPQGSPLALCDTCPRSFHLLCMGLEWEELPEGDWSCPRCAERKGLPTKRLTVDEVKNRQSTGGARCNAPAFTHTYWIRGIRAFTTSLICKSAVDDLSMSQAWDESMSYKQKSKAAPAAAAAAAA